MKETDVPHYIYELTMDVRDYEVDYEGIVTIQRISTIWSIHAMNSAAGQGILEAMHLSGIDPVVRRAEIDYLAPLRSGESFVSKLALERRGPKFIFRQDLYRLPSGELAVSGRITIVSIVNGRLSRGDELGAAFAKELER